MKVNLYRLLSLCLLVGVLRPHSAAAGPVSGRGSSFAAPGAVFTVTNTADSGAGSLRWAIGQANAAAGTDTIAFNIAGGGVKTIAPLTILPTITQAVIIDGTTQPGFSGTPLIDLSGAGCTPSPCHGLWIAAGGSTVRGLIVNRFVGRGIFLDSGDGNSITGNYIGTDSAGTAAAGNNTGIYITNSAGNIIGGAAVALRNVISGNNIDGINFNGAGSTGNSVLGNYIGTDVNGTADLGNAYSGVVILSGASNNTIGGAYAAGRNVISGNQQYGVGLNGTAADVTGNVIAGNFIGLDVGGNLDLGNTLDGVILLNASGNVVGTSTPGVGIYNIISGNDQNGILITGTLSSNNQVLFNAIGVNNAADTAVGNTLSGVRVDNAPNNVIGGTWGTTGNLISGNHTNGVTIIDGAATGNVIKGNRIGTDVNGSLGLGNDDDGVLIADAANNRLGGTAGVTLGGACSGECNLISANHDGVVVRGSAAAGTVVQSNVIGLDFSGTSDLGNARYGVWMYIATNVTLGGSVAAARNVISGNDGPGLAITNGSTNITVQGNYIGLNAAGSVGFNTMQYGIFLDATAGGVTIGGSAVGARNVISGNNRAIYLQGAAGNTVLGNYIGTNAAGTAGVYNDRGIWIQDGANNTIGGSVAGARNIISGNGYGVVLYGNSANNQVLGNYMGLNASGTATIGNGAVAIWMVGGAHDNVIGGTSAAARNVISGNGTSTSGAITVESGGSGVTRNNQILGNFIGTNPAGSAAMPNGHGILVVGALTQIGGTAGTTPGGPCTGACNLIAGNTSEGIVVTDSGSGGTTIAGNYIGTDVSGTSALGNADGIWVQDAAGVVIGGTTAAARNLVAGNRQRGVWLFWSQAGPQTPVVRLQGNFIGLSSGGGALGNTQHGIYLQNSVPALIGGSAAGEPNAIAHNGAAGIAAVGSVAAGFTANSIYGNGGLGIDLNDDGVTPNDPGDPDGGPNGLQNFPVLTSATSPGGTTTVQGTLNSTAGTTFRLEFFSDTSCDASGYGEGRTYLGAHTVTTDGSGNVGFTAVLGIGTTPGQVLAATATSPAGYTSEFSACRTVTCYDFNHNGQVDALDIAAVASRWRNAGLYDATYDVAAPYGVIDIIDIMTVTGRFGLAC